jgi:hypothetical protein
VEAGPLGDGSGRVAVRHSHHPDGAVIIYARAEWEAFTAGVRLGEFDFPADSAAHSSMLSPVAATPGRSGQ